MGLMIGLALIKTKIIIVRQLRTFGHVNFYYTIYHIIKKPLIKPCYMCLNRVTGGYTNHL